MNRQITTIKTVRKNSKPIIHENFEIELSSGITISFSTRADGGCKTYSILVYDCALDIFIYEFLDVPLDIFNSIASLADADRETDITELIEENNLSNYIDN